MAFDVTGLPVLQRNDISKFYARAILETKMASFMRLLPNVKSTINIPDVDHDYDMLQKGSCTRTTRGSTTFDERTITVNDILVAEDFCIKDLENTIIEGVIAQGASTDKLPDGSGLGSMIIDLMVRNLNKAIEIGLWRAIRDNADTTFLGTFTGINKRIFDALNLGIIPLAQRFSVAPTINNIVSIIEDMYDALPIDIRFSNQQRYKLFLSWANIRLYRKGFRSDFGALPYNQDFNRTFIEGTDIELVPVVGLDGTNKMLLTNTDNLILASDLMGEENSLRVYPDVHWLKVHATGQFKLGTQIHFPEEVVTNNYNV